jgi:hypothetical protein
LIYFSYYIKVFQKQIINMAGDPKTPPPKRSQNVAPGAPKKPAAAQQNLGNDQLPKMIDNMRIGNN